MWLGSKFGSCPDFVLVSGTTDTFDGIYKRSEYFSEHGHPVYDGPGLTALSWSHNHWWLTPMSETGESNGYGYLDVPMDCPGSSKSIMRRGGSDVHIEGAKIEEIPIDYGKQKSNTCRVILF